MVLFALSVTYLAKDDPSIFSLNRTERGHEAYNPASYMMMMIMMIELRSFSCCLDLLML